MFNFFKGEQMPSHQEVADSNKEKESVLSAKEKIDEAFSRFKQQA